MPHVEKNESAAPVVGMVVLILGLLGLGFWFLAQEPGNPPKSAANLDADVAADRGGAELAYISDRTVGVDRSADGMGAGMIVGETPIFAGRDIHDVPLGEILDHAQRLPYDEMRGHEKVLGENQQGQTVRVSIWPESGASSMESAALRQGRIVARIDSDHDFEKLGLADGLNYLWVEQRPGGGYQGVIIPATAFVPLYDLNRVSITEHTPQGVPLEKGAYWVNGGPWIACGRC
jgi:hypothetical protein